MRRFDVWVGRLVAIAGIVYVALCSVWPLGASGQETDRDGAGGTKVESPYFFVDSADPSIDRLPLESTRVDVRIAGVIADVVVTQHYRNQGKRPIEARYVFPGGTRAAVYAMNVRLGDRLLTAQIREKQQARAEYQAAKAEGRTAALLEQHRPNVFQMNVANILPDDDVAVELHYTELIVPEDGRYRFVFPTVVGPRYAGGPASAGAAGGNAFAAIPYLGEGKATPATFELHVALASPIGIKDVGSSTHRVDIRREGGLDHGGRGDRVDIALASGGTSGSTAANDRDFVLDYRLAGDAIESGVLLDQGGDERFFLALLEPPKQVASTAIVPREYLFVIDISGSMHGYPLDTAKALLRKLIGGLRPSDTFNVLLFSGDDSLLAPRSLPATQANVEFAIQTIDRQSGGGSTELLPALRHALALPQDDDRSRSTIVITDGYVTVEREAFELVRGNLGRANLFAFGIGSAVNRHLIEGLARAGQGEPFIVVQASEAAGEAERFRRMIEAPVLTHVRLRFEGAGFQPYDVEPAAIGDLFASRPVIVFGKWRGQPSGKLVIEGSTAHGNYRGSVDLAAASSFAASSPAASSDAAFSSAASSTAASKSSSSQSTPNPASTQPALRYLWARHRVASLSDQEALDGTGEQAKAITELGLRYGLLTQYTSFVAVDRLVRNLATATPVDQPSPLPAGVSNLAVGAEVPSTPEAPAVAMLLVALATLVLVRAWQRRALDPLRLATHPA